MARIENWYKQDLKKPVPIRRMETVFNQDALGHLFGVEVYSDGDAVTLAGSVTGYCLLADGTTVPVSGTRSANKASIVIPQTAYSVIGPITITVKLTEGSAITTLLAVVGMVARSRTGQQVNPGSTITDWTNQISAQLQAVQTAADNLGSTLAAPFSTATAYAAGTYVMYNGNLYRFTNDHVAGDWSSSEVTQVKACNEISGLKSALNDDEDVIKGNAYNPYRWEAGSYISIAVGGKIRKQNSEQYLNIRKRFVDITTVDFSSTITMNSGYLIKLFEVDANDVILSATNYTTTVNLQTGKRYAALLKANGDADISNVAVSDMLTTSYATSQIEQNRQDIQQIKSVTDGLAGKDLIESVMVTSANLYDNSTSVVGYYIKAGGSTVSGANYAHTGLITLELGDYVTKNYYDVYGGNGDNVYLYDENGNYQSYLNATAISGTDLMTFRLNEKSYVRLNTSKADAGNNFMVVAGTEASDYPAQFVPYSVKCEVEQGISLNDMMRGEVAEIAGETSTINPLHGKSISFIGDSICAGAGYAGGYGGIIAQENEMIYQNVGVSGATVAAETYASGSPRAWICRRIDQMSETAEYAILEGGVNDASLEVTLGEISNGYYTPVLDDTTFYGAFESCLKQMTIRFPGKKIGYIIPHQMANGMRPGANYYNAVVACCKKWGVPVLDLSTEIPPFNFFPTSGESPLYVMRQTYTASGDGWHPTEAGYRKYYVDKITAWLKAL